MSAYDNLPARSSMIFLSMCNSVLYKDSFFVSLQINKTVSLLYLVNTVMSIKLKFHNILINYMSGYCSCDKNVSSV